jgi:Flp pilus assembly protein TadD
MNATAKAAGADARAEWLAQITKAVERGLPEAKVIAERAKAEGVKSALVHHLLAVDLKEAGRFEEAIVEAGLGLEIEPNDAGLMTTVGFCLLELGRRQESARVFEAAMKLDPTSAEAAFGYGWAAERLGALTSAESAFKRALVLNPRYADALAGLSGIASRRRDWRGARALAEQAVALDSRQTDAMMNLARIDIGKGDFVTAEKRLARILLLPGLRPIATANAHILLGDALDGQQRYRDAFDTYSEGKSELEALFAADFGGTERQRSPEIVAAMVSEFNSTPTEDWRLPPPVASTAGARGHAFLLGFPRTGTTLLEQVIATHPDMAALGERPCMIKAELEFMSRAGGMTRLAAILGDLLEPFREDYWRRVREFGIEAAHKVFVDKHPLSTMRIPLLYKMFPQAKLIFALRDPRDVILSCFRRSFNMNANMYEFNSIIGAARFYDAVMRAGETYMAVLPVKVHRLRHEDLVADFDTATADMCEFLGVRWTAKLNDFALTERPIATPSSVQIGRGLHDEGVGHWRNYRFALEPAAQILKPWIEKFGYPPD